MFSYWIQGGFYVSSLPQSLTLPWKSRKTTASFPTLKLESFARFGVLRALAPCLGTNLFFQSPQPCLRDTLSR